MSTAVTGRTSGPFSPTSRDQRQPRARHPASHIGAESVVENAIIDKNAPVGRGVRLLNNVKEKDGDGY
jgi:hypothetical protein